MSERDVLSNDKKRTPMTRQGRQGGERLIKRSWFQLICCAPVSGREIGRIFQNKGSYQDRGPKESSEGAGVNKMRLGPDDVNLQTEELHGNYSVLIVSAE